MAAYRIRMVTDGEMEKPLLPGSGERVPCVWEQNSPTLGILGTGDMSRSLAWRLVAAGMHVVVGSRSPKRGTELFPEEVMVSSQVEVATQAHVIFVAIYPEHYTTLLDLKEALVGKVLVDVSNSLELNRGWPSNAEKLAALFPDSVVIKAFNGVSAWALHNGPRDGSRQVQLCSDSNQAKCVLSQLVRSMGFQPLDAGGLPCAREVENIPLRLFPSWRSALLSWLALFILFYAYNFLRGILLPYVSDGKQLFYKMPVETVNESLPSVALVMLALVYLPGLLAAAFQLSWGTKYRLFPSWLDHWLRTRKQLGLLSFLSGALHALYSVCLPMRRSARYKLLNAAFKQVLEGQENSWVEEEVWRMELYVSCGILALGLLSLLALTSLPSVANTLNWREFSFIHSNLGYLALAVGTLHTLTFGWNRAFDSAQYSYYLPPTFLLALVLPCAVLLGRMGLVVPCVAQRLSRIRHGWEASRKVRFTLPQEGQDSAV